MKLTWLCSLLMFAEMAQAQSWNWVRVFGGSNVDYGSEVILQQDGKILMTARFKSGLIQFDTLTVVNGMGSGCIVAKFDQAGNRQTLVTGVVSGNVNSSPYIGAGFMGKSNSNTIYVPIGAKGSWGMLDTITIQPWGHIAEFNSAGRCIRAKRCGDGFRCAKAIGNSVYVQGGYTGNAGTIGTFLLNDPYPTAMTSKATIGKLDNNLNAQWAKQVLGGKQTSLNFLETSDNHLYFIVNSDSCVFFDTMQLCSPPGIPSWAVVKTDTNGGVKWYRNGRSDIPTSGMRALGVDAMGNAYVAGHFDTTYYFCGQTYTYSGSSGGRDSYLAKLGSSGNLVWLSVIKSTDYAGILASHTDDAGNTYLTGNFSGQCIFDDFVINSTSPQDFYVARYDSSGICMNVLAYRGLSPSGICQDSSGNFIITGNTFGFSTDDSTYVTNGLDDIIIAKHGAITRKVTKPIPEPGTDIKIYPNPNMGELTVQLPQSILASQANIFIYNSAGSLLKNEIEVVIDGIANIGVSDFPKGLYYITLQLNGLQYSGKFLIE